MSPAPRSLLYDRWLAVVSERADQVAVTDLAKDVRWSFSQLAERADRLPAGAEPIVAEASGDAFLLETLRAWRDGVPLVPTEPGTTLSPSLLDGLPDGVAHVKQTSGTSGVPRAALFTGEQLAADADQIVATMGLMNHPANVAAISLAHSYGFSNLVLPLLLHGLPLILAESPLPAAVDAALAAAGGNAALPAVPAMWQAWLGAGILCPKRVGLAISAGAPLNGSLEEQAFTECGLKIHNFLGSSECGGIAYDRSATPRVACEQVGTAMSGVEAELASDGKLVVRGPAVGLRYWPEDEPEVFGNGAFQTTDLAAIDADGGIRLLGRVGDGINIAGRKASPGEIEAALSAAPGVLHCTVFGVPSADPARCEEVVACVNASATQAELKASLAERIEHWKLPRHWWFCDELEPDRRGKIARRHWRERFLAKRPESR